MFNQAFRAQAAQQKAAADARRDALRDLEERQAEDEGSMPESRGEKFRATMRNAVAVPPR